MTLTDRVKALEERQEIIEASEYRWQALVDGQLSAFTRVCLGNIQTMKNILEDLQKHFESHSLNKKNQYASKRKTYTIK